MPSPPHERGVRLSDLGRVLARLDGMIEPQPDVDGEEAAIAPALAPSLWQRPFTVCRAGCRGSAPRR